jgi:hypothetical protein
MKRTKPNKVYVFWNTELVVASSERKAKAIIREEYGLRRCPPIKLVPPRRRFAMTTDGEDEVWMTAAEIAKGKPGLVGEW